jgi:hypothetical protein
MVTPQYEWKILNGTRNNEIINPMSFLQFDIYFFFFTVIAILSNFFQSKIQISYPLKR